MKSDTPICDFVKCYAEKNEIRMHMPGHKGSGFFGWELYDITEIEGADVLYQSSGIISQSQKIASEIFGSAKTLYSTEGSTLAIRAMLALSVMHAKEQGKTPRIAAARNVHKAFLTGCALLDLTPTWIYPKKQENLLSCKISEEDLEKFLSQQEDKPTAIYVTSPDYLGTILDIKALACACHRHGVLLLVDNAHGAYLHFLPESAHPMALGADLCCDSAHKTLPALTGAAYLHIGKNAPQSIWEQSEKAMLLFASTSPSYLILQSLDHLNSYLLKDYRKSLIPFCDTLFQLKKTLRRHGFSLFGDEPLKIVIRTKASGYTGEEFAKILKTNQIQCEMSDPDHIVLMLTPQNHKDLSILEKVLLSIPQKAPVLSFPPIPSKGTAFLTPKEAMLAPSERQPIDKCIGRILAESGVHCPPAVPIAICGERISKENARAFSYYGISSVHVVKK